MWTQDFTCACPCLKSCPGGSLPSFQPAGTVCSVLNSSIQTCSPFYPIASKALCKRSCYWNEACMFPSWIVKYWLTGVLRRKSIVFPLYVLGFLFTVGRIPVSCYLGVKSDALWFLCCSPHCLLFVWAVGLCTVGECKKRKIDTSSKTTKMALKPFLSCFMGCGICVRMCGCVCACLFSWFYFLFLGNTRHDCYDALNFVKPQKLQTVFWITCLFGCFS